MDDEIKRTVRPWGILTSKGLDDQEIEEMLSAFRQAALDARETVRRHGTKLVLWRDGKVVELTPEELDAEDAARAAQDLSNQPASPSIIPPYRP